MSALRNPVVADVFRRMGFVERWGSGVRRVFDLCRAGGLRPPRVEVSESLVRVTIVRPTPMAEGLVEHRGSDKFGGFHAT